MTMSNEATSDVAAIAALLPPEPVDGFVVSIWIVNNYSGVSVAQPVSYTYYVNTPWRDYARRDEAGAPLVDCWMTSEAGIPIGRLTGWNALRQLDLPVPWFLRELDALKWARQRLRERCGRALVELQTQTNALRAVRARIRELESPQPKPQPTKDGVDVKQLLRFIGQYDELERRFCSLAEWIKLKYSCDSTRAADLLNLAEQSGWVPPWGRRAGA